MRFVYLILNNIAVLDLKNILTILWYNLVDIKRGYLVQVLFYSSSIVTKHRL